MSVCRQRDGYVYVHIADGPARGSGKLTYFSSLHLIVHPARCTVLQLRDPYQ